MTKPTAPKRTYTAQDRQAAVDLAQEVGVGEAARRSDVPKGTLSTWLRNAGIQTSDPNKNRAVGLQRSAEQRRNDLADKLLRHAEWLADRVVADDVKDSDRRAVAVAAAVFVDKHQLLAGGATSRIEHDVTDPDQRLAAVHELKDQAARRAQQSAVSA